MVLLNLLNAMASATAVSRVRDIEVSESARDKGSEPKTSASRSRTGYELSTAGSLRYIGKLSFAYIGPRYSQP